MTNGKEGRVQGSGDLQSAEDTYRLNGFDRHIVTNTLTFVYLAETDEAKVEAFKINLPKIMILNQYMGGSLSSIVNSPETFEKFTKEILKSYNLIS